MELEKDERVYGGHDAAVRADMPHKAHERWLEILKAFIPVTNFAEIGAGRCMSMLMSAVPNNELRNGYHVQFVDEIRHTGMQMSLARWYAKNVPDPAGWNLGPKAFSGSVLTNPGLNMLSHFIVGDPIQCALTLQVVAESAWWRACTTATRSSRSRAGRCPSGALIRWMSATSSGSSRITPAGTRSTARSGRRSVMAPIPPTASFRSTSSTWRRRSAGPAK